MWTAYREKRGPLNVGMRLEQLFAMSDYRYHKANGGKASFDQFVRFHEKDDEEVSLEDIAKLLGTPYEVRKHGK